MALPWPLPLPRGQSLRRERALAVEAAGSVLFFMPRCVWFDFFVPFRSQNDAKVLEQPVVVQSVGTDGRVFQFLVLQLNTTQLASNEGVKNLVWVDSDQLLYQHFWCRPVIKKKVVMEPVGPTGFQPETFRKFLALYLHGAV